MLNKKDNLIIFVLCLIVISLGVLVVLKNSADIKIVENENINLNQNINTNQQVATTIDEININDWLTFKEQKINFTFKYPKEWTYLIKNYNIDSKKIIFNSEIRKNEMIIEMPIPAVGLEPWKPIETKIYTTNDINTDLLLTYMKSRHENEKLNMSTLKWQTGIKKDKLKKDFKEWNDKSAWLYIVRYKEEDNIFYKNIIDGIANSLKFIY